MLSFLCSLLIPVAAIFNIAQVSLWPTHNVFVNSGLWPGYWSSDCEKWFQGRHQEIISGKAEMYSAATWRQKLRYNKAKTDEIVKRYGEVADKYIEKHLAENRTS